MGMPLILIGSLVLAVINLPIPAFQQAMDTIFGQGWRNVALAIHRGTLEILALTSLITVSYALSCEKDAVKNGDVNPIAAIIVAVSCYVVTQPLDSLILSPNGISTDRAVLSLRGAGTSGLFASLLIAILSVHLFFFIYGIYQRFRARRAAPDHGSPRMETAFRVAVPAFFTLFLFALVTHLSKKLYIDTTLKSIAPGLYEAIARGNSIIPSLVMVFFTQISWFFGLHGGNLVMETFSDAAMTIQTAGTSASVGAKQFFDTFVYLGGAGATLGLMLALFLAGGKGEKRSMALTSLVPGIFNINEVLLYGLPIIFSPYYAIPFVMTPVVLSLVSYGAFQLGLVPPVINTVEWTTPIFLSGYLSTESLSGALLQLVNLALATSIYIPFVRLNERHQQRHRQELFNRLGKEIQYVATEHQRPILKRNDEVGALARSLARNLKEEFKGSPGLHLRYQPKVNGQGQVKGAEALLRWIHPVYGYVSPIIILRLAEEAGLTNALGNFVIAQTFRDLKGCHEAGYPSVSFSLNLSPKQLAEDAHLESFLRRCAEETAVAPDTIELELTENATIDPSDAMREKMARLRAMGFHIAIDDFGVGHSSLLYVTNFYADVVKIDASLANHIDTDEQRQEIVRFILSLCKQLDAGVLAEGVETAEQLAALEALGCPYYQGYYFAKALPFDDFMDYVKKHGTAE